MKIYFIRHAPTAANMSGTMAAGYENADITLLDKPEDWEERVGCHIPDEARKTIISSPTRRCLSTAKLLFDQYPNEVSNELGEFDCKGLGPRKFWEITQAEFETLVPMRPSTMELRAKAILSELANNIKHENGADSFVAVSHGMVIRYLYHYINKNPGISAYEVINSKGFRFSNLDLLVVDTEQMCTEAYHWQDPVNHAST